MDLSCCMKLTQLYETQYMIIIVIVVIIVIVIVIIIICETTPNSMHFGCN